MQLAQVYLMAAKGLTRSITKRQARSYRMTTPNPIGVTAIASINRRTKAYKSRYARTRSLLGASGKKKGATSMLRKRARRNGPASDYNAMFDAQMASARKPKKRKLSPAKRAALTKARAAAAKKRIGKSYGKFKSVVGRVGKKSIPTYGYKGKQGKTKKIPLWAILGAKGPKDFAAKEASSPKFARRVVRAKARREKVASRVLRHGDLYTPNGRSTRRRAVSFKTWSQKNMLTTPNKRKTKKKARKGHVKGAAFKRTKQYKAMQAGLRKYRAKKGSASKTHAKKRTRRAAPKTSAKRTVKRTVKRAAPKKRTTAKRRTKRTPKVRTYTAKKSVTVRRKRGGKISVAVANRRRKARKNVVVLQPNRRRRARRNAGEPVMQAAANRRRRGRKHAKRNQGIYNANRRRRYRRNPDVASQLKAALMQGIVVGGGFFAHRIASYLIAEKGLASIEAFKTGSMAEYRGIIGSALALAIGVPLAAKVAPRQAASIGVGMAVSLFQKVVVFALTKANQPEVAGYLAGYPDAEGRQFSKLSGYGAYELVPGLSGGMGAYDYYRQYQGLGSPLQQAAAGYGSELQQAAAGVGEFFLPGAKALGEYEASADFGPLSGLGAVDDGIHPNLDAAEHALSVSEAAAGIGDLPMWNEVDAFQVAAPVMDGPQGSRAGILQGSDGVFG